MQLCSYFFEYSTLIRLQQTATIIIIIMSPTTPVQSHPRLSSSPMLGYVALITHCLYTFSKEDTLYCNIPVLPVVVARRYDSLSLSHILSLSYSCSQQQGKPHYYSSSPVQITRCHRRRNRNNNSKITISIRLGESSFTPRTGPNQLL